MANSQNLRPPFTPSEARENGKKGAAKSVQTRRQNKTLRESMELALRQPVTDPKQLAEIKKAGIPVGSHPTYQDFMIAAIMLRTAQKGKMEDLLKLMEVTGESKASVDVTVSASDSLADVIQKAYEKNHEDSKGDDLK